MSKQNLEKVLRSELDILNDVIDQKIIKGLSYTRESKRHRFILASLSNIRKEMRTNSGWLTRSLNTFSII